MFFLQLRKSLYREITNKIIDCLRNIAQTSNIICVYIYIQLTFVYSVQLYILSNYQHLSHIHCLLYVSLSFAVILGEIIANMSFLSSINQLFLPISILTFLGVSFSTLSKKMRDMLALNNNGCTSCVCDCIFVI